MWYILLFYFCCVIFKSIWEFFKWGESIQDKFQITSKWIKGVHIYMNIYLWSFIWRTWVSHGMTSLCNCFRFACRNLRERRNIHRNQNRLQRRNHLWQRVCLRCSEGIQKKAHPINISINMLSTCPTTTCFCGGINFFWITVCCSLSQQFCHGIFCASNLPLQHPRECSAFSARNYRLVRFWPSLCFCLDLRFRCCSLRRRSRN